jgi:hypothetical protein
MTSDDDESLREPLPERELLSRLRANTEDVIDEKTQAKASLYIPDALIRLGNAAPGECNWRLPDLGPNVPSALARAIALATKKLRDQYLLDPSKS